MNATASSSGVLWRTVLWIGRLTGVLAIVPLLMILVGESGSGPAGAREWIYLALFPLGFSAGYLLGWRWPVAGGGLSLACMVASLIVINRTFGADAYLIWALLCVPGALLVLAGMMLREPRSAPELARLS